MANMKNMKQKLETKLIKMLLNLQCLLGTK